MISIRGISVVLLSFLCLGGNRALGQRGMSPLSARYLDTALDLMQEHSLHRAQIAWADLRKRARDHAAGAETEADTYEAIRFALRELGDHHSFLQLASPELQVKDREARARRRDQLPNVAHVPWPPSPYIDRQVPAGVLDRVGQISVARLIVPSTGAQDKAAMQLYVNQLGSAIARLAAGRPAGWVVDLRGNLGGNMWPMLAGLEPLLHGDTLGFFIGPDDGREAWFADFNGAGTRIPAGQRTAICAAPVPAVMPLRDPPVAVLVDLGTASAAEAVAIAFVGRPTTRIFGRHTAGQSTANQGFALSDGARLVLTTAAEADRSGHVYADGIEPEVLLPEEPTRVQRGAIDPMTEAAAQWIGRQSPPRGDLLNAAVR